MKVAIHAEGAGIRGNERQVIVIARHLMGRGHEVVVSCRAGGALSHALAREGAGVTGIRPRGDGDPISALRFARWLRRERADAVLLTSWKRILVAGWAARVARVPRVVLRLGGVHAIPSGLAGWKYRHALTRYYDLVIVNSRVVGEHLLRRVPGLAGGQVRIVPNGIQAAVAAAAPLRDELGVPPGGALLVSVGGLERRKGYDLLIRALAELGPGVHVAVAGDGPDEGALRAQAASLGVADRVHLLGHRSDIPAVLAASDVFVLPSRGEGMAVAMLEAVAAGKPVVAADVGGVREVLAPHDGRPPAGWVVPPEDARALAGGLAEVIALARNDRGLVDARVEEAAWRLDHWFTIERMIDGYEESLGVSAPRGAG